MKIVRLASEVLFRPELKDKAVRHIDGEWSTQGFPRTKNGWGNPTLTGNTVANGPHEYCQVQWKARPNWQGVFDDFQTHLEYLRSAYLVWEGKK